MNIHLQRRRQINQSQLINHIKSMGYYLLVNNKKAESKIRRMLDFGIRQFMEQEKNEQIRFEYSGWNNLNVTCFGNPELEGNQGVDLGEIIRPFAYVSDAKAMLKEVANN